MRIRFENNIQEITDIDVVKAYDGKTMKCDLISIWMKRASEKEGGYVGYYDLDAIDEAQADEESNALLEALLVKGWCEEADFGHFIWY